jgi:hypothetical protein
MNSHGSIDPPKRGYIPARCVSFIEKIKRKADDQPQDNVYAAALARYTLWLTVATAVVAAAAVLSFIAALLQWNALSSTDAATQKLAKAALDQASVMQADQRPWMQVEKVEPYVYPLDSRFGGLNYSGSHIIGFLPLHFMLKNAGRAPAFDVRVGIGEVFGYAQKVDDLAKVEQDNCVALDKAYEPIPILVDNTTFIRVIFPGDELPYDSISLVVTADQLAKYSTGEEGKNEFQLRFYGCIRYNAANDKEPHQTSFAYRVSRIVDAPIPGGKAQTTFTPWEDVPADRIFIETRPMAAGITN